jgi:MFS transporter, UMF1 family
VVDHTTHRRTVGVVSGFFAVTLIGAQISISQDLWFFCLCIDALQSFALLVHTTAVFAYLPDLSIHESEISHYTAHFNVRQFGTQFVYVCLLIVCGEIRGTNRTVASTVQTAQDAAGMTFGIGALFITYAWTFLFRARPALTALPEGSSLLTAGFSQVGRTARKVWSDYRALRWFMFSLLWSPEAGAGVVQSIAVTFLTVFMKFTGQELAKTMLVLMVGNMVGSLFSKFVCQHINPLHSYRLALFSVSTAVGLSVLVLDSPERRGAVYGFAMAWGWAMGWTYPSQRVLFCTLIPKGQETEMMGLFVFMGQILGWLPPLIVTILNENHVSLRWSLAVIPCFCLAAIVGTLPMGHYQTAVELVARDSNAKLQSVVEATSQRNMVMQSGGGGVNVHEG